jgi:hypothetical protein
MSIITNSADARTSSASGIDSLAEQVAQLDVFAHQAAANGIVL